MADPQRREQRRTHLDASAVPIERALLHRADLLEKQADELQSADDGGDDITKQDVRELVGRRRFMAHEFRALAEELHFW